MSIRRISRKDHYARNTKDVLRLSAEVGFWRMEYLEVIKKFYPITWKEEMWKAELRLMSDKKEGVIPL